VRLTHLRKEKKNGLRRDEVDRGREKLGGRENPSLREEKGSDPPRIFLRKAQLSLE